MSVIRISPDLLCRIKTKLHAVYGDRLKGVMLYGSEARGEATEDSDIDILVLLDGPLDWWDETTAIIHSIYPIQLEIDRIISVRPVDAAVYEEGEFPLYRNVKEEGILL
jgi:predicted nucleotidyltransferase